MNADADGDPDGRQGLNELQSAADRASAPSNTMRRIPGGLDLPAAEADQHGADDVFVHRRGALPGRVALRLRVDRGVDDVGKQDGGQHACALARRRVEAGAPGPVDHHELFVALHPGDVAGRQVEHLVGPDDHLLALVGPDAHPSPEDHTAVIQLARGGANLRLGVFLPAPARLQDMASDHRSGQAHLGTLTQRMGHHCLGSPRSRTRPGSR